MLFYSKLEDSLKTKLVKVIIGTIRLGEGAYTMPYSELVKKANEMAKKAHISTKKISIQPISLEVYYERLETKDEYQKRIEQLQLRDLQEFYNILENMNAVNIQREELKKVYGDLRKKGKTHPADWQEKLVEKFFSFDPDRARQEIKDVLSDAVKYPQLEIPEYQYERLNKLINQ